MERYRTDLGPKTAKEIKITSNFAIASQVYSGQSSIAYEKLDNSPKGRPQALAAKGSIEALARTWRSMQSGEKTESHTKFMGYLKEMDMDQLHKVFVRDNNFATLLYTGNGAFCIGKFQEMNHKQQVSILKQPDAVARLLIAGEDKLLKRIADGMNQTERDAVFTPEVRRQISGFARSRGIYNNDTLDLIPA